MSVPSFSMVALGAAENKEEFTTNINKVQQIDLNLKGYAITIEELQGLLMEHKPEIVFIAESFADQADAIKEGIHSVNKDVKVVAIPKGKKGPEAVEWLKSEFQK